MSLPQVPLIRGLLQATAYPHTVGEIQVIETHISWVLLTGDFAYKIKKPVNTGFADFSTLERRRICCQEELRLNRRLAPDLYLDVIVVTGTPEDPRMGGSGPVLEYAVRMQQFDNRMLLSALAERGKLVGAHIDHLAQVVAGFHAQITVADAASPYCRPAGTAGPAMDNLNILQQHGQFPGADRIPELRRWTESQATRLADTFRERAERGMVRDCHGDMHLGNIFADAADHVTVFDCIEFNDRLRWIDIMSEVAFVVMDLDSRDHASLAARFLDQWLQLTGDYSGLRVLPFYLVYRALVRAKVGVLRSHQAGLDPEEKARVEQATETYLDLAASYVRPRPGALLMTCGLSGSGKSVAAAQLVEDLRLVRIRSDVERKRLAGLSPLDRAASGPGAALYTTARTTAVYEHLLSLAEQILNAGFSVIVDATFLRSADRDQFTQLAGRLNLPCVILKFDAPAEVLKQRVRARRELATDASDATEEIVDLQLTQLEPLTARELNLVVEASRAGWRDELSRRLA